MTKQMRFLGFFGLIPFILLAVADLGGSHHAAIFLISYAALIFSFLGGLLWGQGLTKPMPLHSSLVSVSAMLWAWVWLLMPGYNWFWLAALSFIALWLYEWLLLRRWIDPAFLRLRGQLSFVAAVCLLIAAI
jgi:hypothetical protein